MKAIARITTTLVILIFHSIDVSGQTSNYATENSLWYPGTIVLADGQSIKGEINYNFVTDIVRHSSDGEAFSHLARNVAYFIIESDDDGKKRKFYSLPIKEDEDVLERYVFFEKIYERDNIALLSKHIGVFKIQVQTQDNNNNTGFSYTGIQKVSEVEDVYEVLYLAATTHKIAPYARLRKDKNRFISNGNSSKLPDKHDKSKTARVEDATYKITNKKAFYRVTEDYSKEVKQYIKGKRLKLNTIDEIIKMLDYYSDLKD